jgi:hypothetical protein
MNWFIVVVGVLLLVIATPIALLWWKLARKAAPYGDESRGPKAAPVDEGEVIVLPTTEQKRGGH